MSEPAFLYLRFGCGCYRKVGNAKLQYWLDYARLTSCPECDADGTTVEEVRTHEAPASRLRYDTLKFPPRQPAGPRNQGG
jgi:hypothetical protein